MIVGYNISSVSQYLEVIKKLQEEYSCAECMDLTSTSFLYRGMSDCDYSLLPKVLRGKNITIDEYYEAISERLPYGNSKKEELLKRPSNFTQFTSEKGLLEQFIQEASGYVDIPPDDLIRWAEYAQHYGVPTRFLDWTTNPLTALYFSLRERENIKKDGVVWILHKNNYELYNNQFSNRMSGINKTPHDKILDIFKMPLYSEEYPVLYTPNYVDIRMSVQGSYFMVWGSKELPLDTLLEDAPRIDRYATRERQYSSISNELLKTDCFMKYSEAVAETQQPDVLRRQAMLFKFQIVADAKQTIFRDLDLMGINEKTLFPGLDGIGQYIEKKNRWIE